jgi:hypothetical protein
LFRSYPLRGFNGGLFPLARGGRTGGKRKNDKRKNLTAENFGVIIT